MGLKERNMSILGTLWSLIGDAFQVVGMISVALVVYRWIVASPLLRLKAYVYVDRTPPQPRLVAILYARKRALPTLTPQQYEKTEYWKPRWHSRRWFKQAIYHTVALDGRFTVKDLYGQVVEWSWPVLEIRDKGRVYRQNLVGVKPGTSPVIHPRYRRLLGQDAMIDELYRRPRR